jgi:hypothetical protein
LLSDLRQISIQQRRASGVFFNQGENVGDEYIVIAARGLEKDALLGHRKIRNFVK